MSIKLAEGQIVELSNGGAFTVECSGDEFYVNGYRYTPDGYSHSARPGECDVKRIIEDPNDPPAQQDLSRRDQFAMAAMQGLLASDREGFWDVTTIAERSAGYADALIAELDEEKP